MNQESSPSVQLPPRLRPKLQPENGLARYGSWPVVLAVIFLTLLLTTVLAVGLLFGLMLAQGTTDAGAILGKPATLAGVILLQDVIWLLTVYFLLVRRRVVSWQGLGFARQGLARTLGWGLLCGLGFIAVSAFLEFVLAKLGVRQTQGAQLPLADSWTANAPLLLAGIVFTPIAEEAFFRGFIFEAIKQRKGLARALAYSSILFGLLHANL
ncbi:MAG: CPBP family intramembrane metalloprotease, partial [Thermoleophilia bacterium]|nr:CPBP family intramembrane metalloprotease [Thermoleophilia bacterium]